MEFDVVTLPDTDHVSVGDQAPDFTRPFVTDEYWEDRALTDVLADGPVLLLFHPMDGSFPATYLWQTVRGREWATDRQVLGVSISTPSAHKDLLREHDLSNVGLFSDPAADIADAYGVGHDLDGMTGITGHRPAAFVIDEDRTVTHAWVAGEWPAFPDYDAIEAAITDL